MLGVQNNIDKKLCGYVNTQIHTSQYVEVCYGFQEENKVHEMNITISLQLDPNVTIISKNIDNYKNGGIKLCTWLLFTVWFGPWFFLGCLSYGTPSRVFCFIYFFILMERAGDLNICGKMKELFCVNQLVLSLLSFVFMLFSWKHILFSSFLQSFFQIYIFSLALKNI